MGPCPLGMEDGDEVQNDCCSRCISMCHGRRFDQRHAQHIGFEQAEASQHRVRRKSGSIRSMTLTRFYSSSDSGGADIRSIALRES